MQIIKNNIIAAYNFERLEDDLWFVDTYHNCLSRYDLNDARLRLETLLPMDNVQWGQYGHLVLAGNYAVIESRASNRIAIYNIKTKSLKTMEIETEDETPYHLFSKLVFYKDKVFLLPGRSKHIVIFDLATEKLEYIDTWYNLIEPFISDPAKVIFSAGVQHDNKVFLSFWQGNIIMEFDMETYEFQIYHVSDESCCFSGIRYEDGVLWVCDKNKPQILSYEIATAKTQVYEIGADGFVSKGGLIDMVLSDRWIYALPLYGNAIVRMKRGTQDCEIFDSIEMEREDNLKELPFANLDFLNQAYVERDVAYISSLTDGCIYKWNFQGESIQKAEMSYETQTFEEIQNELYRRAFSPALKDNEIIHENEELTLEKFLMVL